MVYYNSCNYIYDVGEFMQRILRNDEVDNISKYLESNNDNIDTIIINSVDKLNDNEDEAKRILEKVKASKSLIGEINNKWYQLEEKVIIKESDFIKLRIEDAKKWSKNKEENYEILSLIDSCPEGSLTALYSVFLEVLERLNIIINMI